ncbi:MAG: hypothetical protein ACXWHF_00145 [Chthoniobacterales bacterium]
MMRPLRFACLAGILCLAAQLGWAGVIYDNGPPDNAHGSESTHWIQADNFVLKDPARLDSLVFWDFEQAGFFAGTIVWQIYSDDGSGTPGALLFSGSSRNVIHSATGLAIFGGFNEYVTTFDIGPISLPRGTYWIGLHNGDLSNGLTGTVIDWNFYWEATGNSTSPPSLEQIAPYDGPFGKKGLKIDLAFQLIGVAAPPSLRVEFEGNDAHLSFASNAGATYRIDYKDTLVNSSWTTLSGADRLSGTGEEIQLTDFRAEDQPRRFYRVAPVYDGVGAPVISAFNFAASSPQISFTTTAGYFYRVEYKNEMSDLSWTAVSGAETVIGSGGVLMISDPDPNLVTHPRRFYRATLQ